MNSDKLRVDFQHPSLPSRASVLITKDCAYSSLYAKLKKSFPPYSGVPLELRGRRRILGAFHRVDWSLVIAHG